MTEKLLKATLNPSKQQQIQHRRKNVFYFTCLKKIGWQALIIFCEPFFVCLFIYLSDNISVNKIHVQVYLLCVLVLFLPRFDIIHLAGIKDKISTCSKSAVVDMQHITSTLISARRETMRARVWSIGFVAPSPRDNLCFLFVFFCIFSDTNHVPIHFFVICLSYS